jgi:hypothetical protein
MKLFKKREIPSDGIHMLTGLAMLVYWPIVICIPFLTPDDILRYSWARSFVDFSAQLLPLVAEVGKASYTPTLYFAAAAINLAAIIFSFITLCSSLTLDKEIHIKLISKLPLKEKMIRLFIVVPLLVIIWWTVFFQPSAYSVITSKINMGTYGSFLFGVWFLLGFAIVNLIVLCILFRRYLQRPVE